MRYSGRYAALAMAMGFAHVAVAQQTTAASGAGESDTLEEVVVTAEKRPENLQNVPESIQVISGEQLLEEGKKRIDDIMDGAVGVQAQSAEVGTSFYMRGVGTDRGQGGYFGSGPTQQAVGTIIDGVYAAQQEIVRGGSVDIAQVEVLRGPQSTNLGASSLAGAVSITTNDPAFKYEGRGTVEYGDYNKLATEGVLNVPLSDSQAVRIVASTEKRDAYYSSGVGDSDLLNVRLKYRWQVNDKIDLMITGAHQTILGAGVSFGEGLAYEGYYVPYSECTQSGTSGAKYNCSDTTGAGAGVETRGYPPLYGHVDSGTTYLNRSNPWNDGMPADAWGHPVYAHTILNDYNIRLRWDLGIGTLTVIPALENGSFASSEGDGSSFYVLQQNTYNTRQVDAHLDSEASSPIQWLVGVNYLYSNTPGASGFVTSPGVPGGPGGACAAGGGSCAVWAGIGISSQTTKAAYANTVIPIWSSLRAIGGLRYTEDTKEGQGNVGGNVAGSLTGPSTPFVWGPTGKANWSRTTFALGLEYDVLPQSMVYARYSTGYQPGNVQLNPGTGAFSSTPTQTISQFTVGIKNRFFDNRLQLNVEAFDALYHNRGAEAAIDVTRTNSLGQANSATSCVAPAGPPPSLLVGADYTCLNVSSGALSIPDLTSRGVDLEVNWLPTPTDHVDGSLEYLRARQSSPVAATPITLAAIEAAGGTGTIANPSSDAAALLALYNAQVSGYSGATLQSSPQWSGNLTYQHDFVLPNSSRLSARLNMQYKSSYWTAATGLSGSDSAGPLTPENPGPAEQTSYELFNAFLVWSSADGKFTATGYVKNLADKPVLLNWGAANGFRGASAVDLDAPRTFGVIASASF